VRCLSNGKHLPIKVKAYDSGNLCKRIMSDEASTAPGDLSVGNAEFV